ncbi:methyl-accepting chemotaxis protein [Caloramator quimbayensis]|uniref:Methyl-accepting chemotaxis protein n=1 Tax=Caloramator quimbayensis TaxID=1147123 RepID=A0A1T4XTI0_9CLOT|nr:methyl-accepting chemotaxis protein [Caloramator quimbayensis]SKA92713.1 methyl-accepting chemotaxis protein [Caloramator quimbayensis]
MIEKQLSKINKTVLQIHLLIFIILALGFISEYIRGNRPLYLVIAVLSIALSGLIIGFIFYKKKNDSSKVKWILMVTYGVGYIVNLLTATKLITFIFLFPYAIIYTLYADKLLTIIQNITAAIVMGIFIVLRINAGATSNEEISSFNMMIGTVVMYLPTVFMVVNVTKELRTNMINSLLEAENKEKEAVNTMKNLLEIAALVKNNSMELNNIIDEIASSTMAFSTAVEEIAQGASNTAEEIQNTNNTIEKIKEDVDNTSMASKEIKEATNITKDIVDKGQIIINDLSSMANEVNEKNKSVSNTMDALKTKSDDIVNITGVIAQIAEQTNLLALNAAIEAARIGEAGRGFAVVAEEIKKLALESKNNSDNIANIINELQNETISSVKAVTELININQKQQQLVTEVSTMFNNININVSNIREKTNVLNNMMDNVLDGINRIANAGENIAAVSEETMANSQEAAAMSKEHINQTDTAKKLSNELLEVAFNLSENK